MISGPGSPIRVVVVGYGFSGRRIHAPLLDAVDGFQVAGFVARSPKVQALVRHEHPGALVLPDLAAALLSRDRFDLLVVATPDDSHVEIASAALMSGLHVVVDKPLTPSSSAARELARLADAHGVSVTAFQNKRWDADFLAVADEVRSGSLGQVTRYDAWITRWAPDVGDSWREQARPGTLDGRLADLGSHLVDQAVSLFGRVRRVYAELDRRRPDARTNDDVFIALTHADGVRAHIHMGAVTSHLVPTFQVQGLEGSIVTSGTDGQFAALAQGVGPRDARWRSFDTWTADRVGGRQQAHHVSSSMDWRAFYARLEDMLINGAPPPVPRNEVEHGLAVLEAAVQSDRTGSAVTPD